jgi:hypothetical protein
MMHDDLTDLENTEALLNSVKTGRASRKGGGLIVIGGDDGIGTKTGVAIDPDAPSKTGATLYGNAERTAS